MGLGDILSKLFKKENEKEDEKGIKKEISLTKEKKKEDLLAEQRKDESLEPTDEEFSESLLAPFGGEIYTETMGDLYMSQQLYERAIGVFEKLLECDPENQSFRARLERARARLIAEKTNF
jgi:tetratricopeptide (TPR) repeat protein